jgi:predicted MFS family arabinose efflux permease
VAFSLLNGTESAFIYDSLKALGREHEYPKVYGRSWAIMMAAGVAGTLIGAPLAEATSLPFPIVLSGGLAAMAVVAAVTFTEPLPEERGRSHLTYGQIIGESFTLVRERPSVRYGILFFGVISLGSIAPIFFFQPFLREHGFDVGDVGIYQTPMRLAGIVGALSAQRILAVLGERRTFVAMPVTIVTSYFVLAAFDVPAAQIAFLTMNFVVVLSQPAVTDYLNRRVESERRATVISLTNLARSAFLIPCAPLLGELSKTSLEAAFLAGGLLVAAISVPLMIAWLPQLARGERREPVLAEQAAIRGGDG